MGSKYRWFDFADSRHLQGDDARVERLGQQQELIGESWPVAPSKPAASTKAPPAERNSEGHKRCSKGKACAATCIARADDCLLDFPPEVQDELKRVSHLLLSQQHIQEGSAEDEALGQSLSDILGVYGNSVTGKAKSGQTLYPPEVAAKYAQFQKDGKFAVQKAEVSDDTVEAIWASLPAKIRADLRSKGQPPNFIQRDDVRGKMILKTLLETGFRDEITGQPYSWKEIQPDHRVPIAFFPGDKKADVEKNGNLVMVHKGYNQLKGSLEGKGASQADPESFVRRRLEEEFTKQANRSREEFNRLVGEAASKDAGKSQLKQQLRENSPLWSKDEWVRQIESLPGPALQALTGIEAKRSGVSNRFSPSYSQGRNFAPKYASAPVLQVALLSKQGIDPGEWPPGLVSKVLKTLKSDLDTLTSRSRSEGRSAEEYKSHYITKLTEFAGAGLPTEIKNFLQEQTS